ncbi:sialidase family protein, partial [Helicobacter sp. T3_23-1059]
QNSSNFTLSLPTNPQPNSQTPQKKLANSISHTLQTPLFFDVPNATKSAHASTIIDISNLQQKNNDNATNMLLYFAGSREGASDVCIYQSFFVQKNVATLNKDSFFWSEPKAILCPQDLSKMSGKFIKKLGNPVSFVDSLGRVHLFVVGVSMGGWATSKIYHFLFLDSLKRVKFVRELHLSPILNLSHLVRNPAMILENGDFILPVYNEFAKKYPLLLYVDSTLVAKTKFKPILPRYAFSFPNAINQLQPSFVPLDFDSFFGVFRNYKGDNIMKTALCKKKADFDKSKCEILRSNLTNFDFSSVLFRLDSTVLLLHNHAKSVGSNPREELWLYKLQKSNKQDKFAKSSVQNVNVEDFSLQDFGLYSDFKQVDFIPIIKIDELLGREVSYPSVAQNSEFVHISYTFGREHIRTAIVPKAYILQKLTKSNNPKSNNAKSTKKGQAR